MTQDSRHLKAIVKGCRRGNPKSQRALYEHYYGYAMSICLRYAGQREEAVEILNDAFLKAFTQLDQYKQDCPFKPWLRRILINTAIDHHRRNQHQLVCMELSSARELTGDAMPLLSQEEDVLPLLQQLPPTYRLVFNLAVMEEYRHEEIAAILGITASTSRANLARAKGKLRSLLLAKHYQPVNAHHGG